MTDFEIFEHTADIGLRLARPTLAGLYRDATFAFFQIIAPGTEFRPVVQRLIKVHGDDAEQLLVNWLSELNVIYQTEQFAPAKIDVSIKIDVLEATVWGGIVDPQKHNIEIEIKAVTYHKIYVKREADLWRAQIILDI